MSDFIGFVILLIWSFAAFGLGYGSGYDSGAIAVAKGEVVCEQPEQPNKTTEWECKSNQP